MEIRTINNQIVPVTRADLWTSQRLRDLFQEPPTDVMELKLCKQGNIARMIRLAELVIASKEVGHPHADVREEHAVCKLMQLTTETVAKQSHQLNMSKDKALVELKDVRVKVLALFEDESGRMVS